MGLYTGVLKNGINFALEPEWVYIWVNLRDFTVLLNILFCHRQDS